MTRAIVLAITLLLASCAGTPERPIYYLLRPAEVPASAPLNISTDYSMGELFIAPYIDQPGLLLETERGQVRAAALHLWAEPIYAGIRNYMTQEISLRYGQDLLPNASTPNPINIRIDQLHGTADGEALLVAYWWIGAGTAPTNAQRFVDTAALEEDGYGALAAAERSLLSKLAQEIASALGQPSASAPVMGK